MATQRQTGGFGGGPLGAMPLGAHFYVADIPAILYPALDLAFEDRVLAFSFEDEALEFIYDDKVKAFT